MLALQMKCKAKTINDKHYEINKRDCACGVWLCSYDSGL